MGLARRFSGRHPDAVGAIRHHLREVFPHDSNPTVLERLDLEGLASQAAMTWTVRCRGEDDRRGAWWV
ncbi:MAG: hypothetical protein K0V04_42595 [Deltaproteobacteria bacterium]|nr:hypothetical protein [Deltaproteobacteria bacterium]